MFKRVLSIRFTDYLYVQNRNNTISCQTSLVYMSAELIPNHFNFSAKVNTFLQKIVNLRKKLIIKKLIKVRWPTFNQHQNIKLRALYQNGKKYIRRTFVIRFLVLT